MYITCKQIKALNKHSRARAYAFLSIGGAVLQHIHPGGWRRDLASERVDEIQMNLQQIELYAVLILYRYISIFLNCSKNPVSLKINNAQKSSSTLLFALRAFW